MSTAFVTGASSGIGAKYAERLAARGFDVVLVARNKARLQESASRLQNTYGVQAEVLAVDLAEPAGLSEAVSALYKNHAVDFIVNSAGLGPDGPVLQSDETVLEAMVQLNVVALHQLTLAAVKAFKARGRGTIVNLASVVALLPEHFNASYCATKSFVLALTQGLSAELADTPIRLQAVLPGLTRTEIFERAGFDINLLDPNMVMDVGEMVDAALKGLSAGELVTIPSLPELEMWHQFTTARLTMAPFLSLKNAAARYQSIE